MEIKILLSEDERTLLGVEEVEFSEADALHLLFDAIELFKRNSEHLGNLRGNAPGVQSSFNKTWHENAVISGLVDGLERITGSNIR